jgi:predicted nicotinamide N-methyase
MNINLDSWEFAARFDSLYQYFSRKYKLNKITLEFGKLEIFLLYISDVDQLLDDLIALGPEAEAVKDEQLPYWADIWPASIALSNYIFKESDLIKKKQILDLGCGAGLSGILATFLGAEVTINDYQQEALRLSEMNWLLNVKKPPKTLLMDWRNSEMDEKYDIILASDVVYEKRFFHALVKIFDRNLSDEGKIILSEPNRTIARDFFPLLEKNNFTYQKTDSRFDFRDKSQKINVYVISRY